MRMLPVLVLFLSFSLSGAFATDLTFGGYNCAGDCSDHRAGYEWAEEQDVIDEAVCETILARWPERNSFYEGYLAYIEDPDRGADEDDDGDDIE